MKLIKTNYCGSGCAAMATYGKQATKTYVRWLIRLNPRILFK